MNIWRQIWAKKVYCAQGVFSALADARLDARLCTMIYEIESDKRPLGFQNFDELEAYVASIAKTLP